MIQTISSRVPTLNRSDALWVSASGDVNSLGILASEAADGFSTENNWCGNILCWFEDAGWRHDMFLDLFTVDRCQQQTLLWAAGECLSEQRGWRRLLPEKWRRWDEGQLESATLDSRSAGKELDDVSMSMNMFTRDNCGSTEVCSLSKDFTSLSVDVATTTSLNADWLSRTMWWQAGTQLLMVTATVYAAGTKPASTARLAAYATTQTATIYNYISKLSNYWKPT